MVTFCLLFYRWWMFLLGFLECFFSYIGRFDVHLTYLQFVDDTILYFLREDPFVRLYNISQVIESGCLWRINSIDFV